MELPYLPTGEWTERSRPLLRPALGITLFNANGAVIAKARALIDSGADFITFPTEWAELLGIDLDIDCLREVATVADGRTSARYAYTAGLRVELAGERLLLPVVMFCAGMPIPLLGRRGFFDEFLVLIDQTNLRFFLQRSPEPSGGEDSDGSAEPGLTLALH